MEKRTLNKKWLASGILLISLVASVAFFIQSRPAIAPVVVPPNPPQQQTQVSGITYQGESGKDALTLLKQKATVEQDKSGLVTSINGRKSDNVKHEYWAFYINDKSASVGPADYQTQDSDTIQWKIDKY